MPRCKEEKVEREHADDRNANGIAKAEEGRRGEHREQVEHSEAEHRRDRSKRVDRSGHDCDRDEAQES